MLEKSSPFLSLFVHKQMTLPYAVKDNHYLLLLSAATAVQQVPQDIAPQKGEGAQVENVLPPARMQIR